MDSDRKTSLLNSIKLVEHELKNLENQIECSDKIKEWYLTRKETSENNLAKLKEKLLGLV